MKKIRKNLDVFIRGIGVGIIITATLFYFVSLSADSKVIEVNDSEVIDRAKELGMVFITELNDEKQDIDNNEEIESNEETEENLKEE